MKKAKAHLIPVACTLAKVKAPTNQETLATGRLEYSRPATYNNAIVTTYNHSMGIQQGQIR